MMGNRYEQDFSLSFDGLREAKESDGARLSEQCELHAFRKAREYSVHWEPTRQIVEALCRRAEAGEREAKKQSRRILLLQTVTMLQSLSLVFLALLILALR